MASRCHFHQFSTYFRRVDARPGLDSAVNVTCRRLCFTRSKTRLACRCTRCFGASEVSDLPADCIVVPGVAQMAVLSRICFVGRFGWSGLALDRGLGRGEAVCIFPGLDELRFEHTSRPVPLRDIACIHGKFAGTDFWLDELPRVRKLGQMLTFALSAIVALWVMLWRRDDLRAADALLVAITTSALVSYHLLIHDLS